MPCIPFAGGLICTRGKRLGKKIACFVRDCRHHSPILCDWIVGRPKDAEPVRCSRPCCHSHSREVGKDKHLCLEHFIRWLKVKSEKGIL